jgi:hypothetical protein
VGDASDTPVKIHRLGESRRFNMADATCIGCQCFDPPVVRDVDAKALEYATCRTRLVSGCPEKSARGYALGTAYRRSKDGWTIDP